jgi:hypothetical protein
MTQAEAIDRLADFIAVEGNEKDEKALERLIEDLIPVTDDGSWRTRNGL